MPRQEEQNALLFLFFHILIEERRNVAKMSIECKLCGAAVMQLRAKKINGGYICPECMKMFKGPLRSIMSELDAKSLMSIIEYETRMKRKGFEETASFGQVSIDDPRGLISIDGALFSVLDIEEISLYCINPCAGMHNKVYCDVEMNLKLSCIPVSGRFRIANHVTCQTRLLKGNRIEWNEPGTLGVFRSLFNQMIMNRTGEHIKYVQERFALDELVDVFRAESLFLLQSGYTKEDIERREKGMLKVFESDINACDYIVRCADLLESRMDGEHA